MITYNWLINSGVRSLCLALVALVFSLDGAIYSLYD